MSNEDRPTIITGNGSNGTGVRKPPFSHPTPLKILLYARSKENYTIGVREVQRQLQIKTISTVSWHLNKLIEDGYLEKSPNNKYQLTELGQKLNEVEVALEMPVMMLKGRFLPPFVFTAGLILMAIIVYSFLMFNTRNPFTTQVYGLLILIVILGVNIYQLVDFRRRMTNFLDQQ